jgi:diacylglycerol kinase (ATP)
MVSCVDGPLSSVTSLTPTRRFRHVIGAAHHAVPIRSFLSSTVLTLLVNPAAGQGRAAAHANEVERALGAYLPVRRVETARGGDERRLAREAVERGATMLAVVGGDGSVHHAAHGLLDVGAPIPLAIFSAGTGNDFVKTLGIPSHDIGAMAARVARGHQRTVDVGYIDDVPFVNAAGFGFDVEVLQRMRTRPFLSGTAAYVWAALAALLQYGGFRAALSTGTTAERTATQRRLMTVVANGNWFGGAFHIAPDALLDDGALDVIDIGDVPSLARLPLFARATRGTHVGSRHVAVQRGAAFTLEFGEPPLYEADGELMQAIGPVVSVRIKPRALTVIV